ncbi:bacteriohemerythrin [Caldimonas thermodepolymerans]|jgi:hemerythrin|uniref:bacteriohemerythrin n=1 Tax=Caldimonas thermodepolymerans TaxID=215580 RepID=UPI0022365A65|nr:hemerythrin domain-containing protein [Caldimonas thermodepolymerans]UZG46080.1 hemerythrin domain-containing protein [Caldimonas thermodepolymerans]
MTTAFCWSDQFLLGYSPMDATHKEFVACVAALQAATEAELPARLDALAQHCAQHFQQEEEWMASTGFPAAQCHADEHAAVLRSVREVQAMCVASSHAESVSAVVRNLARALIDWFPGHADYMDAALAHWMVKRTLGGIPVVLRRGVAHASPLPDTPALG